MPRFHLKRGTESRIAIEIAIETYLSKRSFVKNAKQIKTIEKIERISTLKRQETDRVIRKENKLMLNLIKANGLSVRKCVRYNQSPTGMS